MNIIRLLLGEMPAWTSEAHPVTRYYRRQDQAELGLGARLARVLVWVVLGTALATVGVLIATDGLAQPFDWRVDLIPALYVPAVLLQMVVGALVLLVSGSIVMGERQLQRWDTVRATQKGAWLLLRVRWWAVLMRFRVLIGLLVLVRVVFVLFALVDLYSIQGQFFDFIRQSSVPVVSLNTGMIIMAAAFTASLLVTVVQVAFFVALGQLIGTLAANRAWARLLTVLVVLGQALSIAAGALVLPFLLDLLREAGQVPLIYGVGVLAMLGDWGLTMMQPDVYFAVWQQLPYGLWFGPILLVWVVLLALLTQGMLRAATSFAHRANA